MSLRRCCLLLFLAPLTGLAACDDPVGFRNDAVVVTDTVLLAAPSAERADIPSALDVTVSPVGAIGGGRFPERPADAQQWDLAVRLRDGDLVFLPAAAVLPGSDAAITEPVAGQTFESLEEVPDGAEFVTDRTVPLREGAVYVVRSRDINDRNCSLYAKLAPLEVDPAQGTVRVQVATSAGGGCFDERLVSEDEG